MIAFVRQDRRRINMINKVAKYSEQCDMTLAKLTEAIIEEMLELDGLSTFVRSMLESIKNDCSKVDYEDDNSIIKEQAELAINAIDTIKTNSEDSCIEALKLIMLVNLAYQNCEESLTEEEYQQAKDRNCILVMLCKKYKIRVYVVNDVITNRELPEDSEDVADDVTTIDDDGKGIVRTKGNEELRAKIINRIANRSDEPIIVYGLPRSLANQIIENTVFDVRNIDSNLQVYHATVYCDSGALLLCKKYDEDEAKFTYDLLRHGAFRRGNLVVNYVINDVERLKDCIEDDDDRVNFRVRIAWSSKVIDKMDCVNISSDNIDYEDVREFSALINKCVGVKMSIAAEKELFKHMMEDKSLDDEKVVAIAAEHVINIGKAMKITKKDMEYAYRTYKDDYEEVVEISSDAKHRVNRAESLLSTSIFGQEEALKEIMTVIRIAEAGLNEKDKPLASMLFVGPTGTGKTETAKKLAEAGGYDFARIDMGEFSDKTSVTKFLGTAPGYVGYDDGSALEKAMRGKDRCILLLDEIEKAEPSIFNAMMQILDNGEAKDGHNKVINFRNSIIIMTSNAGASDIGRETLGFMSASNADRRNSRGLSECVEEELRKTFRPEFINRIDSIVQFNKLNTETSMLITKKLIRELEELAKCNILINQRALDELAGRGCNIKFGAREIKRVITKEIKRELAEKLLDAGTLDRGTYRVDFDDKEFIINKEVDRHNFF